MKTRRCSPAAPIQPPRRASDLLVRSYSARMDSRPSSRVPQQLRPVPSFPKVLPSGHHQRDGRQALPIYGDGKQQRDWLHVEDNCRGVLAVLERGASARCTHRRLDIEENLSIVKTRAGNLMGKPDSLSPT